MQIFHNQNLGKLSLMKSIKINKIIGEKSNPIFFCNGYRSLDIGSKIGLYMLPKNS